MIELRNELLKKEVLIHKNQEKLQTWQTMLTSHRGGQGQGTGPGAVPGPAQHPHPQQTPHPLQGPSVQAVASPQPGTPQTPTQSMPPPTHNPYPQGPLAYLEQTTSNIGLPERR